MFSLGRAEQEASRGRKGGDVQWAAGSRTQEVERDLGAGQRALGVSSTQPGMDGNTQQVRRKEDGLRPKPGAPPCMEQMKKRSQVEGDIHQTLGSNGKERKIKGSREMKS